MLLQNEREGDSMKVLQVLGVILAVFRNFMSAAVIDAIKKAAVEAVTHDSWTPGERTAFVIDAGRAVVAATPNPWDDLLYEAAAALYLKKYAHKLSEAAQADASATPAPV
jgi:hypothetical protein